MLPKADLPQGRRGSADPESSDAGACL